MSCASSVVGKLGKRSRNVSETAPVSSFESEVTLNSDVEDFDCVLRGRIKRSSRSKRSRQDFGSKMSTSSDEEGSAFAGSDKQSRSRQPKCFSKNAIIARQNRMKKKKYLEDLENEIQVLRKQNAKLKTSLEGYSKDMDVVRKENLYLRNVLANSREIGQLLRAVNTNSGLPTSTSLRKDVFERRKSVCSPIPVPPMSSVSSSSANNKKDVFPDARLSDSLPSRTPSSESLFEPPALSIHKTFPITMDDVPLSVCAPEDEEDDLFSIKNKPELDFNLNDSNSNDHDYFGADALVDWLDGDEALANLGVCLHVANQKVSLEFCATCNEKAFSNWNDGLAT